jgi:hypothetical protein
MEATSNQPPPPGRWHLTISSTGWALKDPHGGSALIDVIYQPSGRLQIRPTIEVPPFPNPGNGGFCDSTDPISTWTVAVDKASKTMTLRPAAHDPCGDRVAILEGSWSQDT